MNPSMQDDFLIAGARDFLRASAAIASFGDHVHGAAASVIKKRAAELTAATELPITGTKVKQYQPSGYVGDGNNGTAASIGASISLPSFNFFELYVWWHLSEERRAEQECSLIASFRCKSTKISDALFKVVHPRSKAQVKLDGYEVYLEQAVEPDEFPGLQKHFDALVSFWIGYATAIGGLKKHLMPGESK